MNLDKIKQLIYLAEEHDLSEIEVQFSFSSKVRIVRGAVANANIVQTAPIVQSKPVESNTETKSGEKEEAQEDSEKYSEITAPIVGTFYRKPSPEDDPYVKIGDHIEKGQVVCLIEAMKIFNEIKSEISGKIVRASVEDGQPVEYGHTLFLIDPNA